MLEINHILCPIDFSEFSVRAYDYAQSLARHYNAQLTLEHVVEFASTGEASYDSLNVGERLYRDLRDDTEKAMQRFVKDHTKTGIQPTSLVHEGIVTDCILNLARAQGVDLIVMGTYGRRGFDRFMLGSVTERVLRKANCPVFAVRKPAHDFVTPRQDADPIELRKIVVCTDFSDYGEHALTYAFSLAMEYKAELTLLHVLENISNLPDLQTETARITRQLEGLIPYQASKWCTPKSVVRIGKPYQEIIQLAMEAQTDMVVLGVRGRNALDLALFGSTTHRVIQLGPCPVLTVHIPH